MGGPAAFGDLERPLLADEAEQAAPGPVLESSPAVSRPSEAPRPLKPLTQVCPFILANEFCERLAFYGLATNLVNFFGGEPRQREAPRRCVFALPLRRDLRGTMSRPAARARAGRHHGRVRRGGRRKSRPRVTSAASHACR